MSTYRSFSVKAESTSSDTEAAAFKHFGTPTGRLPNRRIYRVGYLPGVEYVAIHNQCSIFGWCVFFPPLGDIFPHVHM